MKKAIIGKKIGMTQIFDENGKVVPVTVVEAGPCVVVQKKTIEKDGYEAIQVGFGEIREKLVNKPRKGHFAKAGVACKRYVKELKLDNAEEYNLAGSKNHTVAIAKIAFEIITIPSLNKSSKACFFVYLITILLRLQG